MRLARILILVLAAFMVSAGVAQADPVSLSSLLTGGTISVGDKTFADFGFQCLTVATSCTNEGIVPSNITVDAFITSGVYFLQFGGDMISGGATVDFRLRYSVTATAGLIVMIDQHFNLTSVGAGGTIGIGEHVYSGGFPENGGVTEAFSSVGFGPNVSDFEDPVAEGDDLLITPGRAKLYVEKDVNISPAPGSILGTSILRQSFHQTVPEPTSVLLLGAGLMGLALWRRHSN